MRNDTDSILETIKVIFASDTPLASRQLEQRTNLCRRTVQRHIKRLERANIITVGRSEQFSSEQIYHKAI